MRAPSASRVSARFYQTLIRLHPPAFRREFGDQILCIFDEMSAEGEAGPGLIGDAMLSLMRQWFLRTALWKGCAAASISTLILAMFGVLPTLSGHFRPAPSGPETPIAGAQFNLFLAMTMLAMGFIATMLAAIIAMSRAVSRKRIAVRHARRRVL